MPTSRIPSPARSQSAAVTPRRYKPRGSRSVGSPARSDVSGRLTSVINMKNSSFALSPMPSRRSVLADTTDIEEPKRRSWWRQLGENSRDVIEVIESNKVSTETNNIVEDLIEMDVLSQEKKSYNLDLPESSDNESIHSIIMPQRKLFKQKDNEPQNKFGQLVGNRETLPKLHKPNAGHDKSVNVGPRELFNTNKQRNKPIFPAALLDISLNKTAADSSKEKIKEPPKNEVRNIFGNRPTMKRKNMFAEFVVSESEDEIPEIQPKVFGFSKKSDQKSRGSTISRGKREPSPASSVTTDMELDDWRMLPSSTMVAEQLEEAASATPVKRPKLSKLSEAKESDAGTNSNTTVDKTKQSNKSIASKNKSKNVSSAKDKSLDMNRSMTTRNASKTMLKNSQNNISHKDLNISSNKSKNNTSKNKRNSQKNKSVSDNNVKNDTFEKSNQNISKSKTFNIEKHMQKTQENNIIDNLIEPNNEKNREIIDNEENNFTLEYESDDQKEVTAQNENKLHKNKTVTLKRDSNLPQKSVHSIEEQDISLKKLQVTNKKTVDETEESQTLKENELVSTEIQSNKTKTDGKNISKCGRADKEIGNQGQTDVDNHDSEKQNIEINQQVVNHQNQPKQQRLVEDQMEVDEITDRSGKLVHKQITFFNEDDKSMEINSENKDDCYKEDKKALEVTNVSLPIDNNGQHSQINRLQDQNDQSKIKNQESRGEDEIEMQHQNIKPKENVEQKNTELEPEEIDKQLQNEYDQEAQNTNNEQAQDDNEEIEENDSDDEGNENNEEQNISAMEQDSVAEEPNVSNEEIEDNESEAEEENESEAEEQNESAVEEQNESIAVEQNDSEVEEQNESKEIQNESQEEIENESQEEEQNETRAEEDEVQEDQVDSEEKQDGSQEELNISQEEIQNESQASEINDVEEQNESDEDIQNESELGNQNESDEDIQNESDVEDHNESQDELNESEGEEQNLSDTEEQNESDTEEQNASSVKEHNESQEQSEDVIEKTDTPNSSGIKSPEAILHEKTNQADSFTAQGRNTSIRKSKSMIRPLNIRPSMAPPRESTGLSDGARDSSAEGSGWDSHRTTRKTLRQTFGRDFTPRKSLRALVMEKSAKRQTYMDARSDITMLPQANSTEYREMSNRNYDDDESMVPSDHELSRRTRQATLEMCLAEIKKKNMERRQKTELDVRNLFKPSAKENNQFKVPARPMFPSRRVTKPAQKKSKPKQINSLIPLDDLPPEMLDDMKYKPPKRFQPSNASWITKRLYKFLETKLEPKYDYKARVRAEKLVETIYHFSKELRRHDVAPTDAVEVLKHEMARLEIVKTHFEFYEFFNDYMPREIRVKVIPDIVNKISMPKHGIFSEIQL